MIYFNSNLCRCILSSAIRSNSPRPRSVIVTGHRHATVARLSSFAAIPCEIEGATREPDSIHLLCQRNSISPVPPLSSSLNATRRPSASGRQFPPHLLDAHCHPSRDSAFLHTL